MKRSCGRLERTSRNMNSLSRYSRSNAVNREWIEEYLNEAHANGWRSVRCHVNVVAWAESDAELKRVRNEVGAQIALMGCTPHHNTVDVPVLFWAGIPGNEGDFPAEESFTTFLEPAVLLLCTGDLWPGQRLPVRNTACGPTDGSSGFGGHLGRADEARRHYQQK